MTYLPEFSGAFGPTSIHSRIFVYRARNKAEEMTKSCAIVQRVSGGNGSDADAAQRKTEAGCGEFEG
jgi:hypothetical protein